MYMMAFLFWLSAGVIIYIYIGYPLLIALLAKLRPKPVRRTQIQPSVTLLIAAYNEEDVIREKIENSINLNYPKNKLEIVIVADGSTDRTCSIVREYHHLGVVLHDRPERKGKLAALNRVVPLTHGEIILFSDANNMFRPDAVSKLASNFWDPNVGAVTGKKLLFKTKSGLGESENLYWRYESFIRAKESQFNSTTGVAGEILSIRRDLYIPTRDSIINDDLFIAMQVVKQGYRVIYEPEAISEELPIASIKDELIRRARISAGYYQLIRELLLLLPSAPFFVFQAISHKLLRPFVPFFMIIALLTNLSLVMTESHSNIIMIALAIAQLFFYILAAIGFCLSKFRVELKPFFVPYYFCYSNFSYLLGLFKFLFGKQNVLWEKPSRESEP